MRSTLTVSGVSFELPNGRELFSNLNFSLDPKVTALVGPNGIGKTTLARILCGEIYPTDGKVNRNATLRLFPQREEPKTISVNEYLTPDYSWSLEGEKLLEGINREALCSTLSGGEWMRVRLAHALNDQYLILDEPTNDLDRSGRATVLNFLRNREEGTLLISHDRECLEICETILELSNQGISKFGGGWDSYTVNRERERNNLQRALEKAKHHRENSLEERNKQKARQERKNRRGAQSAAKGGQAKILLGRRKRQAQASTGKLEVSTFERAQVAVQEIHTALTQLKIDPIMYADLVGTQVPSQKLITEAKDFNIRFNDKWLYPHNLNFSWRGNVRVAVKGPNGAGKSTLLRAILGEKFNTRGHLRKSSLPSLYIDQRCASLDDEKTIYENVCEHVSLDESAIRNGLAKFLFMKESVFQKTSELSGGERLRAALARGFLGSQTPELLILDEPTNNLDLVNIEFLEGLIGSFQGAVVIISHDETFLKNCQITDEFHL